MIPAEPTGPGVPACPGLPPVEPGPPGQTAPPPDTELAELAGVVLTRTDDEEAAPVPDPEVAEAVLAPVASSVVGTPLLTVEDLRTYLATGHGVVRAVDGVSFEPGPGRGPGHRRGERLRQDRHLPHDHGPDAAQGPRTAAAG